MRVYTPITPSVVEVVSVRCIDFQIAKEGQKIRWKKLLIYVSLFVFVFSGGRARKGG